MISKSHFLGVSLLLCLPMTGMAQSTLQLNEDDVKATLFAPSADTLFLSYNDGVTTFPVMSNTTFTASAFESDGTTEPSWFSIIDTQADRVVVSQDYTYSTSTRNGILRLTAADGTTYDVPVVQRANSSATTLQGDIQLTATGSANQAQSGEGIEYSLDGDYSTMYHSPWYSTSFPVILTYTITSTDKHVDYIIYTPRTDGNTNGNFGNVTIEYSTTDASSTYITLGEYDFEESSSARRVDLGDNGLDNVSNIRFTVTSGGGDLVSCAEMGFYQTNAEYDEIIATLFTDELCTEVRSDVTDEQIDTCGNAYFRQLAHLLRDEGYSDWEEKFRIGEFECYETVSTLADRLKTSNYNSYENPTGIYFTTGNSVVLFVSGLGDQAASLNIHDFNNFDGENDSSYPLTNGINVITPTTTGNGYINYYSDSYASAPNVKIHFAMADVTGYFDLGAGDTNDDWTTLLANACSDILDVRTPRMQVAFPTSTFSRYCPSDGVALAEIYDEVIRLEHEQMGLIRYNEEPKNRQFARIVSSGMYADGTGAGAADPSGWMTPSRSSFDFWGFAHELGHTNQIRPSFRWTGLGECTNNVYAAWVQFSLSEANWLRLESESSQVFDKDGNQMAYTYGGRFNCYLQQNVCEGVTWQFAEGGDYAGETPTTYTVTDEDEDGNTINGTFTGERRNFDHFVKLAPLWQLQLYGTQCGFAPNLYDKVLKGLRDASDTNSAGQDMTNGQQLMRFVRTVCDSTKLNFLPFFEKAGMFCVVKRIIEDYTPGLLNVSQKMLDEVTQHVEEAGYETPVGEINYISGLNWEMYKNQLDLVTGEVNEGCTKSGTTVTVSNSVWQNAVAFETYDSDGELIAITMYGLGHSSDTSAVDGTSVLFPSGSARIDAVSWNGTRVTCYQQ